MGTSIIVLGLEDLPSDTVPPQVYDDFLKLHRAVKNLADGVSRYAGVDAPTPDTWPYLLYQDTILTQNHTRIYPVADVNITAGQLVNLYNNAGVLRARLASANSASTMAHGIAMQSVTAGNQFEMYWLRGLVNTIGGMTVGTLYWLSPTSGAVQNIAPNVAGTIQQAIGVAVQSALMIMDIPLYYKQN